MKQLINNEYKVSNPKILYYKKPNFSSRNQLSTLKLVGGFILMSASKKIFKLRLLHVFFFRSEKKNEKTDNEDGNFPKMIWSQHNLIFFKKKTFYIFDYASFVLLPCREVFKDWWRYNELSGSCYTPLTFKIFL